MSFGQRLSETFKNQHMLARNTLRRLYPMVIINQLAPDFHQDAFINGGIKKIKLSDYKGKWVILFFYPADFTFVCPSEIMNWMANSR